MSKPRSRNHSEIARNTALLLGELIRVARLQQRMTAEELAQRAGVSRGLVTRVEKGDMGAGIGAAFEMVAILDVSLFEKEEDRVSDRLHQTRRIGALLPRRATP